MSNPNSMQHNYLKKIYRLGGAIPQGSVAQIRVSHDDWCGIFDGQSCDCDPEIRIVPSTDASG